MKKEEYITTEGWIDEVEGNSYRKAGEPFKYGPKTDEKRLKALLTKENRQKRPLIKKKEAGNTKQGE